MRVAVQAWVLLLAAAVIAGCANAPHRTNSNVCTWTGGTATGQGATPCPRGGDNRHLIEQLSAEPARGGPSLSFVEYSDQGILFSRQHYRRVLSHLRSEPEAGGERDIIVFVHGWHHNASGDDGDVRNFRQFLREWNAVYPERRVDGVYVGWRGESIPVPVVNKATFWGRKFTSLEVGDGQVVELFAELDQLTGRGDNQGDRLIILGHSLGASLVVAALGDILLDRAVANPEGYVRGFGDAIFLLNPAVESTRFYALRERSVQQALQDRQAGEEAHSMAPPAVMVISGTSDYAVRFAFPLGRLLQVPWTESHRGIARENTGDALPSSEALMDIIALGRFQNLSTHTVEPDAGQDQKNLEFPILQCDLFSEGAREAVGKGGNLGDRLRESTGELRYAGMNIQHQGRSSLRDPLWVMKVKGRKIVDGHSGIFTSRLKCLIAGLVGARSGDQPKMAAPR